jgi:hypothetical protein
MPAITHLFYGLFLLLPVIFLAKDRLNVKAAAVFVINNWIGPDSYYPVYSFIPISAYSAVGYLIWAAPLAFVYMYLTRFSVRIQNKRLVFHDDGAGELTWRNAYLLCVAGGLCHCLIDMIGHPELEYQLFPGTYLTLFSLQSLGSAYYHVVSPWLIPGFLLLLVFIVFILYFIQRDVKDIMVFLLVSLVGTFLLVFGVTGLLFMELEVSTLLVLIPYVFVPLGLVGYVLRDMYDHPVKITKTRLTPRQKLLAATLFMVGVALSLLGGAIYFYFDPTFLITLSNFEPSLVRTLDLVVIGLCVFVIVVTVGMGVFRIRICRSIVMCFGFIMWMIIFPFCIFLVLNENGVKELFGLPISDA